MEESRKKGEGSAVGELHESGSAPSVEIEGGEETLTHRTSLRSTAQKRGGKKKITGKRKVCQTGSRTQTVGKKDCKKFIATLLCNRRTRNKRKNGSVVVHF